MALDRDRAVADLRREGGGLIQIVSSTDLSAPVPSCPEWTLADLTKHLGNVYNWAGTIVQERLAESPAREQLPQRGEDQSELDWLTGRFDRLVSALDAVPLDSKMWNFMAGEPAPPDFWWRRQVHETLIHRVDAETARGLPITPVDPGLAADGTDEALWLHGLNEIEPDRLTGQPDTWIHLHATDVEGAEWTIDTSLSYVTRAHLKGAVALSGPAWALMRWVWGRPTEGDLETFGDLQPAASWRRSIAR